MKITETITRECCDANKDFMLLRGHPPGCPFFFCKHCGAWWQQLGGSEPGQGGMRQLPMPWDHDELIVPHDAKYQTKPTKIESLGKP